MIRVAEVVATNGLLVVQKAGFWRGRNCRQVLAMPVSGGEIVRDRKLLKLSAAVVAVGFLSNIYVVGIGLLLFLAGLVNRDILRLYGVGGAVVSVPVTALGGGERAGRFLDKIVAQGRRFEYPPKGKNEGKGAVLPEDAAQSENESL